MTNYRCQVNGLLGASLPWSFSTYWQSSSSESSVQGQWHSAIDTFFNGTTPTGVKTLMNADVTVTETTTSTMSSTFHQTTLTPNTESIAGTDTHDSLPWQDAVVVTHRTALRNRSGHGRFYLPPFGNDTVVAHILTSASQTIVRDAWQAVRNSMVGAGHTQIVLNKRPLKDGTAAFTIKTVTGFDVPNKLGVQRRRISKVVPTRLTGS